MDGTSTDERAPSGPPGYELGFEIGQGGMATVFYGRRVAAGGFSHAVALKRLHPHLASSSAVASMFLDEARLAARVVHANVISVVDVVQDGSRVWTVMPYIEGETLSALIRRARIASERVPVPVAVAIVVDLLAGLAAAHGATDARGQPLCIVHRDVSPQNVLVGSDGLARVLDFGVAKARGRSHETQDGQVKGKLAYMAPEQLGGDASVATDVYAAAIVLWELLAGRRLFQGVSEAAVVTQALAGATSPPSAHAAVPTALDDVVMRALSLDPSRRFASATALARAIVDAFPDVATREEVARWVEAMASDSLARRRSMAIEMATHAVPSASSVSAEPAAPPETAEPAPRSTAPGSATEVMPAARRGRRRRRWLVVGVLALVALPLGAGASWLISRRHRTFGEGSEPVSTAGPGPAPTERIEPPPPEAPAVPAASATSPNARSSGPRPAERSTVRRGAPAHPAGAVWPSATVPAAPPPSAPPAPAVDLECDPPFVVDANGVRRYKRGCIR